MQPDRLYIPESVPDLIDLVGMMQLNAPKFEDKNSWRPLFNFESIFEQLRRGLALNRIQLGEERYDQLTQMSGQIRALFEADQDDTNGATTQGRKILVEMARILRGSIQRRRSAALEDEPD